MRNTGPDSEEKVIDQSLKNSVKEAQQIIDKARREAGKKIVGQDTLVEGLLMGILAGGHVLVEGVPGLAKTLAVQTFADILSVDFKRIQFTPDLLPADLTGTMIFRQQTGEFIPRKGPVFSHIILADEVNRAPAKVQSALLEAMAEKQVTIGDSSYKLPEPFFVLATQNPIEQEGTYQLPEAQLDRFIAKVLVSYPTPEEELEIMRRVDNMDNIMLSRVLNPQSIARVREIAKSIELDERVEKYIVSLVAATREQNKRKLPFTRFIEYGASPRATIGMMRCARVKALMEGRAFVLPEDVQDVAKIVLRHRIVLSYEAEAEEMTADSVIDSILSHVSVP
ncbi:MAG: MoxR family ATPase [Spirochaetales bacterium]|nr:MoxR family ATPase [Spirochaetales bacterium]